MFLFWCFTISWRVKKFSPCSMSWRKENCRECIFHKKIILVRVFLRLKQFFWVKFNFNWRACLFGMRFFSAIIAWGLVVNFCFKNTVRFSASLSKWCFLSYLGKTEQSLFLFVQGQTLWLKYDLGQLPFIDLRSTMERNFAKSQCPSKTFVILVSYDFSFFYHRGRDMGLGVVN